MDRVDEHTPPQVVYASAADLCRHVTFSKPRIAIEDVDHMAEDETLVSPTRTKKYTVTSAVLLPIPLHWAPLFLTEEEPINAKDAFDGLSKLASSIHRHTTAYATVMTFAWGLITRRTPKAPKPVVAVALTTPRLDRALTTWRNKRLQDVFQSPSTSTAFVDLTSVAADDADAPPSSTRPVDLFAKHNRGCVSITYFAVCPQTPRDVTTCPSRVESFRSKTPTHDSEARRPRTTPKQDADARLRSETPTHDSEARRSRDVASC
jgi:hypothetical protein